jgi:hypothetical protein
MDASVSQKTDRSGKTFITTFTFEGFNPYPANVENMVSS